jgi:AhpD family alkylhydroperoxidase
MDQLRCNGSLMIQLDSLVGLPPKRVSASRQRLERHLSRVATCLLHNSLAILGGGLEPSLGELVKLRASQINGCAFCIYMHASGVRSYGETEMPILHPRRVARVATLKEDCREAEVPVSLFAMLTSMNSRDYQSA